MIITVRPSGRVIHQREGIHGPWTVGSSWEDLYSRIDEAVGRQGHARGLHQSKIEALPLWTGQEAGQQSLCVAVWDGAHWVSVWRRELPSDRSDRSWPGFPSFMHYLPEVRVLALSLGERDAVPGALVPHEEPFLPGYQQCLDRERSNWLKTAGVVHIQGIPIDFSLQNLCGNFKELTPVARWNGGWEKLRWRISREGPMFSFMPGPLVRIPGQAQLRLLFEGSLGVRA